MGDEADHDRPVTRVHRVDDRLGLAVLRASLSARTLVTYARDHVTVRTPSRPGLVDGNTIDLETPPAPADLVDWAERFRDTVGQLGVRRIQLRWEEPVPAGSATGEPDGAGVPLTDDAGPGPTWTGGGPSASLRTEARRLGFRLVPTSVLLLDHLPPRTGGVAEVARVEAPSAVPGGPTDRRWHAATVLYRYMGAAPGPQGWRDWDQDAVAFDVEVQRELATDGRARVWLASRHGAPVGRLTVFHDRQGLAVAEDLVVHPVHRRRGIGADLVHAAVTDHLATDPESRVGVGVVSGSPAEQLATGLGFRRHAVVWSATTAG